MADFSLLLLSLSALRIRSLRQRRGEAELEDRLREWRRSLMQLVVCVLLLGLLVALAIRAGPLDSGMREFVDYTGDQRHWSNR